MCNPFPQEYIYKNHKFVSPLGEQTSPKKQRDRGTYTGVAPQPPLIQEISNVDSETTFTDAPNPYTEFRDSSVTHTLSTPVSETLKESREVMDTTDTQTANSDLNDQSSAKDCLGGFYETYAARTDVYHPPSSFISHERVLKITSLNVCGLRSKTLFPDFNEFVSRFDIIGFQETKTDQLDDLTLPGYILKFKHRANISKRRSGGIALAYKKDLSNFINVIDSQSKLVLWFHVSKRFTKSIDLLCGIVYIPPEGSEYSVNLPYREIENELYAHTEKYPNILLFGDFNSRTKNALDIIEFDPYICKKI